MKPFRPHTLEARAIDLLAPFSLHPSTRYTTHAEATTPVLPDPSRPDFTDPNADLPPPSRKPAPVISSTTPPPTRSTQEPRQTMYLKPTRTYYQGNEQRAGRGPFLILCQPDTYPAPFDPITETRAIVRQVALSQCGNWMMGTARAFGHSLTLSGTYGNDGLLKSVPPEVYARAVSVPAELMEKWAKGGGWNSAGGEAAEMRQWALANLDALTP